MVGSQRLADELNVLQYHLLRGVGSAWLQHDVSVPAGSAPVGLQPPQHVAQDEQQPRPRPPNRLIINPVRFRRFLLAHKQVALQPAKETCAVQCDAHAEDARGVSTWEQAPSRSQYGS